MTARPPINAYETPDVSRTCTMSLIGIAAVHAGRWPPADLPAPTNCAERTLPVETVSSHVGLQCLLAQPVGQRHALRGRHRQLALLALAPEVSHQLALSPAPSVTRLQAQPLPDRLRGGLRAQRTAEIVGSLIRLDGFDHGLLDQVRLGLVAEVLEHHGGGEDGAQRIGHVLASVLRRATMDRLEERHIAGVDVAAGSDAESAL